MSNDPIASLRAVAQRLVDLDWCIGYALTEAQHEELDSIRDAAVNALAGGAVLEPPAERVWQDIASAPKDGTVVALWDDRQHVAFTGFYGRPPFQGSMEWMSNGNVVHPTHFYRLPAPPASSEREPRS